MVFPEMSRSYLVRRFFCKIVFGKQSTWSKSLLSSKKYEGVRSFHSEEKRKTRTVGRFPSSLYIANPDMAGSIANHVLNSRDYRCVLEFNPGPCLLTEKILEKKPDLDIYRLFELSDEFEAEIAKVTWKFSGTHVELVQENFMRLASLLAVDFLTQTRINFNAVFGRIPVNSWESDPSVALVGPCPSAHAVNFLHYLVRMIPLRSTLFEVGRMDIYLLLSPSTHARFSKTDDRYQVHPLSVLFESFFDFDILERFPREYFLPSVVKKSRGITSDDDEPVDLVKITPKVDNGIPFLDHRLFDFFVRQMYHKSRQCIIASVEKWAPGVGLSLIQAGIKYFNRYVELPPSESVRIFRIIRSHPSFEKSHFHEAEKADKIKQYIAGSHAAIEHVAAKAQ